MRKENVKKKIYIDINKLKIKKLIPFHNYNKQMIVKNQISFHSSQILDSTLFHSTCIEPNGPLGMFLSLI